MTLQVLNILLEYERYLPVMDYSEIHQLKSGRRDWEREDIMKWELRLMERNASKIARIEAAMKRSKRAESANLVQVQK